MSIFINNHVWLRELEEVAKQLICNRVSSSSHISTKLCPLAGKSLVYILYELITKVIYLCILENVWLIPTISKAKSTEIGLLKLRMQLNMN